MYLTPEKRIGSLIAAMATGLLGEFPVMAADGSNVIVTDNANGNISNEYMEFFNYDVELIVAFAVIIGFLFIISLNFEGIIAFVKDREYLKMEMKRCEYDEYDLLKDELKKLYITHIPFIGRFFR